MSWNITNFGSTGAKHEIAMAVQRNISSYFAFVQVLRIAFYGHHNHLVFTCRGRKQ